MTALLVGESAHFWYGTDLHLHTAQFLLSTCVASDLKAATPKLVHPAKRVPET